MEHQILPKNKEKFQVRRRKKNFRYQLMQMSLTLFSFTLSFDFFFFSSFARMRMRGDKKFSCAFHPAWRHIHRREKYQFNVIVLDSCFKWFGWSILRWFWMEFLRFLVHCRNDSGLKDLKIQFILFLKSKLTTHSAWTYS